MVNHAIPSVIPRSLHPRLLLIQADQVGKRITQKDAVKQIFDLICAHHFENNPLDLTDEGKRHASFNGDIASLTRQIAHAWGLYWLPRLSSLGTDKVCRPELTDDDVISAVEDVILRWEAKGITAQDSAHLSIPLPTLHRRRGRTPLVDDHEKVRAAVDSVEGDWRKNPGALCRNLHRIGVLFPKGFEKDGFSSWEEMAEAFEDGSAEKDRPMKERFRQYIAYRLKANRNPAPDAAADKHRCEVTNRDGSGISSP